ncbi:PspA/IM30 family protein [Spirochaeta cellobiosiphila]|uniref:PspA/IM30 family protein n=1 Tax=Spirochaeta cellobiosiphila TaxID=504483 RepID=UPI00041AC451|nr:PspA/IM30 family protein [Spirochaeta cellobiosiphila]
MGLFDRIKRVFKSNINDIISKAEDPQKVLNQIIIDMNEQLIESKKSVASAIADEKKLERQMNEHLSQSQEWERKAMLAVKAEKDDLAKEALIRKQDIDKIAVSYKGQWEAQHKTVEQLKSSLRQLQQKIEEAQRKKNLLIARAKRAEAQQKINSTLSKMSNNSAFDAFDRMSAKVDQIEAEIDATQELEDLTSGDTLDKQFEALEDPSSGAELLLEQLKGKMEKES